MIRRRHLIFTAVLATAPRAWPADVAWPIRPVRIIAAGVGGVPDLRARWLADRLSRVLGQPVIVENIAGAGGNIGAERVARSAPDGYTLLLLHQGTAAVNPHIYRHTGYEPLTDFAPITRFGQGPLLMAVPASLPYRSVADVIRHAKSRPGELTYGSPGIGTPPHLASELFKRLAGIEATHVPFRGGGQLATALLGGQITWSIEGASVQMGYVNSGRLRALAFTGEKRAAAMRSKEVRLLKVNRRSEPTLRGNQGCLVAVARALLEFVDQCLDDVVARVRHVREIARQGRQAVACDGAQLGRGRAGR